jgi:hypothetical protein
LAAAKHYGLQHYPNGPLASNHVEGNPGAVDVSDPQGLKRALRAIHNGRLKSAMPEDPVHFSGTRLLAMSTADENGNRATVAIVDAKVDGLKDLIRAEFKDVGRRLEEMAGLEPRIRKLEQDAVRRVGPIIDEMREFENDRTGQGRAPVRT